VQASDDIVAVLKEFSGNPQRASSLASFLGFQPINSPEDQHLTTEYPLSYHTDRRHEWCWELWKGPI
jgi:hypothetical protein